MVYAMDNRNVRIENPAANPTDTALLSIHTAYQYQPNGDFDSEPDPDFTINNEDAQCPNMLLTKVTKESKPLIEEQMNGRK